VRELQELIAALDRRLPQVQRAGEASIARDAAALKARALRRIEELEREQPHGDQARYWTQSPTDESSSSSNKVATASSRASNHRGVAGMGASSPSRNIDGNLITANLYVIGSSYSPCLLGTSTSNRKRGRPAYPRFVTFAPGRC